MSYKRTEQNWTTAQIVGSNLKYLRLRRDSYSAAAKYMIHVKYEKEEFGPIETAALILTNTKPIVKNTLDTGVTVINKVQASG